MSLEGCIRGSLDMIRTQRQGFGGGGRRRRRRRRRIMEGNKKGRVCVTGDKGHYQDLKDTSLVHVDDVARIHIHLFEYPEAKGRYICPAVEVKIEDFCQYISTRYPEYQMPTEDLIKYENGLQEIFDGAIKCCKQRDIM
ncbi:Dihydrokaempferol 4-reductase [Handroanthus impetiginosus]|uniref:Dihydrokaempferol 4-reductase n=1 Tax=Handroanthus impetiginosus TaxID=429701 RepID=A0A2G9G0H0_9LAMI|nr:Dihydrokaempferol 4-reductase [Handroanthus impetiginosus]